MTPYAEVVGDSERFVALEEEWDELYGESPAATPFQSWAWLYSWWEHYGENYQLRLVTIRDREGLLVGLLPLMLERRVLPRRLLFIGSGLTDYLDVLVREGWEKQVAVVGAWAVRRIVGWRVADLQELRPQAAAWSVFGGWTGPRAAVWQSSCPIIEIRPWDELLASLSKNLRSSVRRALRLAEAEGLRRELVGAEGAEEAARGVVALHRTTWEGRAIGPEHLTHRFEEYIATAARRMTARGLGGISELRLDAEPFISTFAVFGRDFLGAYLIGASAEALAKYQWSSLYIWDALDVASHRNVGRLDLLRGEERYKLRWSSEVVANRRLILGRDPLSWGLYAAYHALRLKLRHYVRSERAPRWLREAIDRYRTLKSTAARVYSKRPGRP